MSISSSSISCGASHVSCFGSLFRVQNLGEEETRGGAGTVGQIGTSRTRRRDRDGGTVPPKDFSRRARGPTRERGEEGDAPLLVLAESLGHLLGHATPLLARVALDPRVGTQGVEQRQQRGGGPVAVVVRHGGRSRLRDRPARGGDRDRSGRENPRYRARRARWIDRRARIDREVCDEKGATPRTGVGPARRGMARRPARGARFQTASGGPVGREKTGARRAEKRASRAEKCASRAGTSGEKRRGVSERARRDVSGDQNRTARRRTPFLRRACYHTMMSYTTTETKTRDRDVTGSNPPISLEPRAKRQHPRRRFPRRSRRRPDRRPRHANPRAPVFRGARRSATKPIQNPRNIAAR